MTFCTFVREFSYLVEGTSQDASAALCLGQSILCHRDDVKDDCLDLVLPILGQRQRLAGFRDGHLGLQEEPRCRLPENSIGSYSEKAYRRRATPRESLDQRSQSLFEKLFRRGIKLVTHIRKNMKNKLIEAQDKILLRKHSLIETINDQLKNVCQIEHSRHRCPLHFVTHLLAGLIAYAKQPKKPSLKFQFNQQKLINGLT